MNAPKPNFGDDAEKRADAVILSWIGNRISMRQQRDDIAKAIREAVATPIDDMGEEQRADLFSHYCTVCGSNDPKCQCWNDE